MALQFRQSDEVRALHAKGAVQVLGEVMAQYEGIPADDPQLEPCWALADQLDISIGIYLGAGWGARIDTLAVPRDRTWNSSALRMEAVLVKHSRLWSILCTLAIPLLEDSRALNRPGFPGDSDS